MKKIKMFAAAVMFCAAGFAGYTAYDRATMTDEEMMFRANLEALSYVEIGDVDHRLEVENNDLGDIFLCCKYVEYLAYCSFVDCSEY